MADITPRGEEIFRDVSGVPGDVRILAAEDLASAVAEARAQLDVFRMGWREATRLLAEEKRLTARLRAEIERLREGRT